MEEGGQSLRTGVGTQSLCSSDLLRVPTLLSIDTSVEGSAHSAQDGADQQATSVLWRLLGSEALGPSPGDLPNNRQIEPPAFEEAESQIPGAASGIPGKLTPSRGLTAKIPPLLC